MINNGVHICTQPNDPFTLKLKYSPWWSVGDYLAIMLSGFKGIHSQIGGRFGCGVLVRLFLCHVL